MSNEMSGEWVSTGEAARRLGLTARHVLNLIKQGRLVAKPKVPGVPGSHKLVSVESIDRLLPGGDTNE